MTKMKDMPKTMKFNGKTYKWLAYATLRSDAERLTKALRDVGKPARIVPQRGYYGGGWHVYTRD